MSGLRYLSDALGGKRKKYAIPPQRSKQKIQLSPLERAQIQNCRENCRHRREMTDVQTLELEHCSVCEVEQLIKSERAARGEIVA